MLKILPHFSRWPLRTKLVSIIMLSSAVSLLLSLSVLAVSSAKSRYNDSLEQLTGLATVLAENSQAALLFSDQAEAERLLESLANHREVSNAWLVDIKGNTLSSWSNQLKTAERPANYRVKTMQLQSDFWTRRAELYSPVVKGTELIGYVLLQADFTQRWQRQLTDFAEGLAAGVLALLVAFLLSYRLQRVITRPLGEIAETAHSIARNKTYEARVTQRSDDEIGDLVQSFNNMLHEIQERDRNLTQQRDLLEAEVARRTHELRTIVENTPDTIARYDRDLRRIYVNRAFGNMLAGGVSTLLGKKPSENPGGPNAAIYENKIQQVFASGESVLFELKWPGNNNREIYSQISLTAERDAEGVIVSVLGVGHNITELKEYQAELQHKESAKTRFLAAAGHDMRQPLAAANLFVDALKLTQPSARQQQIIQRLEQSMSNFNNLLDALLNVSKLDAGMIVPDYTSISVIELLMWVEQNLAPLANEKGIGFKLYFRIREPLIVCSDIGLLQSILLNLVSNAIKFTETGGVMLSTRQRGSEVLFQIWDTGLGIENEHSKKIFDEFYQVDNPQRDRTRGLGLGLSIVKRALLLLGQQISYRSQPGRGSVFEFRLPLDTDAAMAKPACGKQDEDDTGQEKFIHGKRVVVLEDDALVAEALEKSLTGMGAEVNIFHNAESALAHGSMHHADFFIVDYMLGGALNGMQFLNRLPQQLGRPVIAVIMTGDTSPDIVKKSADCAWPVVHKPISIFKLINSLRTQMR